MWLRKLNNSTSPILDLLFFKTNRKQNQWNKTSKVETPWPSFTLGQSSPGLLNGQDSWALLSVREVLGPEHFGSLWPFHKMTFYDCICITWQYSHFRLKYSFNLKLGLFFLTKLSKTFATHPSEFWDSETTWWVSPCLCSGRVVGNAGSSPSPHHSALYCHSSQHSHPAPPATSLGIRARTQCGWGHSRQAECRREKSVGRNFIFGSYIYSLWPTSQGKVPFFPLLSTPHLHLFIPSHSTWA